ncbi:MAG: UTP--glucose-1-phosphate uridylyltransferase [Planctomycetales bacterium]|jgi:UDP-N-acetylglucosamine/UDP-N-acetylgalactosamine diphosphorylase
MTSPATHHETVRFLDQTSWFGLDKQARHVFCQGTMPAVDFDHHILMESPSQLCLSPDGHGGIVSALDSSGLLQSMQDDGV